MNIQNPDRKLIARTAPDPREGHDRVRQTVEAIILLLIEGKINVRDDRMLGQGFLPANTLSAIDSRVAVTHRTDGAIIDYLAGNLLGADPLKDGQELIDGLLAGVKALNVKSIYKALEKGELPKTGVPFARFVMVRHGKKGDDGKLSKEGLEETLRAAEKIKDIEKDGGAPVTGIFGVQQAIVQMIMTAFSAAKILNSQDQITGDTANQELAKKAWRGLPFDWKASYDTAEVTLFEVILNPDFDLEGYLRLSSEIDRGTSLSEAKKDYVANFLQVGITRKGHREVFDLSLHSQNS